MMEEGFTDGKSKTKVFQKQMDAGSGIGWARRARKLTEMN